MTDTPAPAPEIPEEMVERAVSRLDPWRGRKPTVREARRHDVVRVLEAAGVPALVARDWQPIDTAPATGPFLVTDWKPGDDNFDHIELVQGPFLADGRILNLNSGNYTKPGVWTWWRPVPALPRAALGKKDAP